MISLLPGSAGFRSISAPGPALPHAELEDLQIGRFQKLARRHHDVGRRHRPRSGPRPASRPARSLRLELAYSEANPVGLLIPLNKLASFGNFHILQAFPVA